MTYPIAHIPYANMAPFKELGPPQGCTLVDYLPRDSIRALKNRQVWAAAVPVGGLAFLKEEVAFVGCFGIAVKEQAMSVLFFSDGPFHRFHPPMTVELTGESASSVRLLYLLLGYENGFDTVAYRAPKAERGDGALVIGDRALRWALEYQEKGTVRGYTHVVDLAQLWYQRFRQPFVFARWVVRIDAPEKVKEAMARWLEDFAAREESLIQTAAPKVAARLDLPLDYARRYLEVIRRCLGPDDEAGQACFTRELKLHGTKVLFPQLPASGRS